MADPRIKPLKIKTGVLKRLAKEKTYYEKEVGKEQERHDKMKDNGADEYQLRKQVEVINESRAMIPETNRRLKTARDDLKSIVDAEADLKDCEEYKEALTQITEAEKVIS